MMYGNTLYTLQTCGEKRLLEKFAELESNLHRISVLLVFFADSEKIFILLTIFVQGDSDEDDEGSEDEEEEVNLDWLPDPDKIYGKNSEESAESSEDSDSSEDQEDQK